MSRGLTRIIYERFCCKHRCLGERRGARGKGRRLPVEDQLFPLAPSPVPLA